MTTASTDDVSTALVRRVSERWGAAFPTVDDIAEWQAYTIRGAAPADLARQDRIVDSLRLLFHGRWGNYVFELINMFHLAETVGIKKLYLYNTEMFPFSDGIELHGITIRTVQVEEPAGEISLMSNYFDHSCFGSIADSLTNARRRELAQKYVLPLLIALPQAEAIGPDDLVIHIRSGDIFEGVEGEGGANFGGMIYTQPPLSFYQAVVRRAFGSRKGSVVIVSENALNPVILPLVRDLDRNGYAVTLRLNQPLTTDLSWLLSGRNVVFANGTIGIAVALLSRVIEHAYFFRYDGTGLNRSVEEFLGDQLGKHYALDRDGSYIAPDGWRNTARQRLEMVEFPVEQIMWADGFTDDGVASASGPGSAIAGTDDHDVSHSLDLFDSWIGKDGRRYADAVARMADTSAVFASFRRNPALKIAMEHLSEAQGRDYLATISDENVRTVLRASEKADRVGTPDVFDFDGSLLSPATVRYAGVLQNLVDCFPGIAQYRSVIELGAGYGGQARLLSDYSRHVGWPLDHYTLVDIDPVIRLARRYLDVFAIRPTCEFVTRSQIDRGGQWDLAISNFAFSMFSRDLQLDYLDLVLGKASAGYLTMNTGLEGHPNWVGGLSAAELMHLLPNAALRRENPLTGDGNYIILFGDHAGDIGLTLADLG